MTALSELNFIIIPICVVCECGVRVSEECRLLVLPVAMVVMRGCDGDVRSWCLSLTLSPLHGAPRPRTRTALYVIWRWASGIVTTATTSTAQQMPCGGDPKPRPLSFTPATPAPPMSKKSIGDGAGGGGGTGWKGRRKISLPWFRQGSFCKEEGSVVSPSSRLPPLLRQRTIDSTRGLQDSIRPAYDPRLTTSPSVGPP
ncbi:hypothetical protein E2C01_074485 [Portunus trituberculatus]|uniref:Uncharacterized protein n=1 Tax=Portunus trituberculatus TaxID=210409 RepID=A0A5B7IEF2_PORTR|nr:hypothetical protein [Portunus trituberculatus]